MRPEVDTMQSDDDEDNCSSAPPPGLAECDTSWKTETVLALARGIRLEDATDRLPILADALEEAGCQQESVLGHCRSSMTHNHNCWVVWWLGVPQVMFAELERETAELRSQERQARRVAARRERNSDVLKILGFAALFLVVVGVLPWLANRLAESYIQTKPQVGRTVDGYYKDRSTEEKGRTVSEPTPPTNRNKK
jgi:hypothetical protein